MNLNRWAIVLISIMSAAGVVLLVIGYLNGNLFGGVGGPLP